MEAVRKVGSIRMEWEHLIGKHKGLIARVDYTARPIGIYLNSDHPRMVHHRDSHNVDALVDHCFAALIHEVMQQDRRDRLKFIEDFESYPQALAEVLKDQQATDESLQKEHLPI